MSKTFKIVMIGLIAGTLLLEVPPAHAIFGIRAAKAVMAARRAKKGMSSSDTTTTDDRLQTADDKLQTTGEKNQSLEDLKRLEAESKKID